MVMFFLFFDGGVGACAMGACAMGACAMGTMAQWPVQA